MRSERHAVTELMTATEFALRYQEHVPPLYRYFSHHTGGNAADAEDLTASTVSKALASIGAYTGRGSLAAWLFGIARHTLTDYHRRRCVTVAIADMPSLADAAPLPEQKIIRWEAEDDLHARIRDLPASQREALTLRYFGALHIAEIAAVLDRSEGAVKLLIHRALTTLRTQYRQEEER